MEITKTVLSLILVVITILTTLTTIEVYAGGDNDDGNKQKAEDDSAAAIADCDDNKVERAGFDCIAIAANDVEIELPEESATLSACKDEEFEDFEPEDFFFAVTGNSPSPNHFLGNRDSVEVTIGPGEYAVSEAAGDGLPGVEITGDCVQDPNAPGRATGEIQAGETQECRFFNFVPN